jgi:hydroxypyruvate reductase/glycerate 2-kinase
VLRRDEMVKQLIRGVFDEALGAVDPYKAVFAEKDHIFAIAKGKKLKRIVLAAFGKAAVPMTSAAVDGMGSALEKGIIVTKYDHAGGTVFKENIAVYEAGHPVPDERGVQAAREVLNFLRGLDDTTLVLFLISGGGSALLACPAEGITLQEKQTVTALLLNAGANIHELNAVRKHISAVKGGRLAEVAYPAGIVSLILSDVIGDPLDVIASGPISPDTSTFDQAVAVINKYNLMARMPARVIERLVKGSRGLISETPKHGSPHWRRIKNIIVGSNSLAVNAAKIAAERAGYRAEIISTGLSGEASIVAKDLARMAIKKKNSLYYGEKACLIAGGETTVTVKGDGKGGRNTEMALAFGIEIKDEYGITFLSAGTDGQDGPTDAAGAIADSRMVSGARRLGLDPEVFLRRNDSYNFFARNSGLVMTGPTGTNVMDIQIIFIEKRR